MVKEIIVVILVRIDEHIFGANSIGQRKNAITIYDDISAIPSLNMTNKRQTASLKEGQVFCKC